MRDELNQWPQYKRGTKILIIFMYMSLLLSCATNQYMTALYQFLIIMFAAVNESWRIMAMQALEQAADAIALLQKMTKLHSTGEEPKWTSSQKLSIQRLGKSQPS